MANSSHLVNRNGVFYWRRRLPAPWVRAFGRSQLLISLRSRDPKAGRRIARVLTVEFDRIALHMELEKRVPTESEQALILKRLYEAVIQECRQERARWYDGDELPPEAYQDNGPSLPPDHPAILEDIETQSFFMDPKDTAKSLRSDLAANRYQPIRWLLRSVLAEQSIDPETDETAFRKFLRLAIHMAAKAFDDAEKDVNGEMPIGLDALVAAGRAGLNLAVETDAPPSIRSQDNGARQQVPAHLARPSARPLSAYVKSFLESEEAHVTGGTHGQKKAALNLLLRIVGDIPADSIKRSHSEKLHDYLQRLPSTFGKSSRHKTVDIAKILADEPGANTMSSVTLDRHWRTIRAFYQYVSIQDDVGPIDLNRIFNGFRWNPKVKDEEPRVLWSDDALEKLFASPIWTGFAPHPKKRHWRHRPGAVIVKDEYWWLPLMALYQGARLEELCQLKGVDVKSDEETGIVFLDFHSDMRLKNEASIRKVPVHSALIALGFLDLAKAAGPQLLFPRLVAGGRDAKLGFDYSQEFKPYREAIGVYRKRMDFHSFRHNFTTKLLRDHSIRELLTIDELTGHDTKERKEIREKGHSMTIGYFGGNLMTTLKEAVERAVYPQIDLGRLVRLAAEAEANVKMLQERHPMVWGDRAILKERKVRPTRSRAAE